MTIIGLYLFDLWFWIFLTSPVSLLGTMLICRLNIFSNRFSTTATWAILGVVTVAPIGVPLGFALDGEPNFWTTLWGLPFPIFWYPAAALILCYVVIKFSLGVAFHRYVIREIVVSGSFIALIIVSAFVSWAWHTDVRRRYFSALSALPEGAPVCIAPPVDAARHSISISAMLRNAGYPGIDVHFFFATARIGGTLYNWSFWQQRFVISGKDWQPFRDCR